MAPAVDTKHSLNGVLSKCKRLHNDSLDRADRSRGRRVQLRRVRVDATDTNDDATRAQFDEHCGYDDPRQRAVLGWQAEQGDDEDTVEVVHHLKHLAATTTKPGIRCARSSDGVDCRAGTTTLDTSVQCPTINSCTQHRPPAPFWRHSTRLIGEVNINRNRMLGYRLTKLMKVLPIFGNGGISASLPKILPTDTAARYHSVIWLVQLDFFNPSSESTYSPSSPGKRRRTLNPFHHVSPRRDEECTTRAHDHPAREAKRFKGVRYRPDHTRWVAEMKPPKSKNKVSFGEFRSQTDAARVVDVAFQHYGKPLNFPDSTPLILSSLPPSAGLSEEEKLKDQIKLMKSKVSSLPSPNPSSSDTDSGLRSFSAIGSSLVLVGSDDADDAVSLPQPWLQTLMSQMWSGGEFEGISLEPLGFSH